MLDNIKTSNNIHYISSHPMHYVKLYKLQKTYTTNSKSTINSFHTSAFFHIYTIKDKKSTDRIQYMISRNYIIPTPKTKNYKRSNRKKYTYIHKEIREYQYRKI